MTAFHALPVGVCEPRRVSLADATEVARRAQKAVRVHGWAVCLFGSTLTRGEGNDVDLYAVNFSAASGVETCIDSVVATLGATVVQREDTPEFVEVMLALPGGVFVDLKVQTPR